MDRAEVTMTDVAAMRAGVRELGGMVRDWSDMIEQINRARAWTPSDVKGFNRAAKEEIVRSLDAAAEFLRRGRTAHIEDQILAKIEEVRGVVGAAEAYVEIEVPKIERPPEIEQNPFHVLKKWREEFHTHFSDGFDHYEERDYPEGAPNGQGRYQLWKNGYFESKSAPPKKIEPVKVVDPWVVLEERRIEGKFGDMHLKEIREYDSGDANGKYQEWFDGKFYKTVPEADEAKYAGQQEASGGGGTLPTNADMGALLRRLEVLK